MNRTPSIPSRKPSVLVISSTVVRGAVGGRAATFALERLGFPVWTLATVTLPWHPGHGRAGRIVPDDAAFEAMIDDLLRAPWLGEVGGILTGYMGSPGQPAAVARLIDAVRGARPYALYLCDPVMGDNGALYIPPATAEAMRAHLAPRADILTPNPTELAYLAGRDLADRDSMIETARALGRPRVAITSSGGPDSPSEALLISRDDVLAARHARVEGRVPNGTGDLFAALMLGRMLEGIGDRQAFRLALSGVVEALQAAQSLGADELPLAAMQDRLVAPEAPVELKAAST